MDKVDIQALVNYNSEQFAYNANNGRSSVWKEFSLIRIDGALVPTVMCAIQRYGGNPTWAVHSTTARFSY